MIMVQQLTYFQRENIKSIKEMEADLLESTNDFINAKIIFQL